MAMKKLHLLALAALVVAYALGPMATQIVTPAVPFVHRDLAVPMATAQTLISLAFVTIAMATLVYGPLADRYGRRPLILAGTGLFCLGSVGAALAPNAELLIAARMVQAAGSSAGLTLTRTVIYDVYGREGSGRVIAYLTTVMIFVPMLSPAVGGVLLDYTSWRMVFATCALFGLIALSSLAVYLPETHFARRPGLNLGGSLRDFAYLLRDRNYIIPALFFSCIMATYFATQAAIPYLMINVLERPATEYGAWFALGCAVYVAGNYLTGRFGHRFARRHLIIVSGGGALASAAAGMLIASQLEWSSASLFIPAIVLYFFGAISMAPIQAEAIAAQPERSGSASGLMTAIQMAVGAVVVQGIGFNQNGTPYPMYVALIACSAIALLAILRLYYAAKQRDMPAPAVA